MNTQQNKQTPPTAGQPGVAGQAGTSLPMINELASVIIGCVLASPKVSDEYKELTRKEMDKFENFDVVMKQNTADEVHIAVPCFPELDVKMADLSEEEMAAIAGGEVGLIGTAVLALGSTLGAIGLAAGITGGATTVAGMALGATIGSVVAGAAIVGAIGVMGATAVAAAGVGIGLGVAMGIGAMDGGVGSVRIGLVS